MTFSQFLNVLNNRKFSIAFIFMLTIALSYGVSQILPKKYKATASVILNLKGVDLVTAGSGRLPTNTHVGILQSRRVALKVVENLKLASEQRYITQFLKTNRQRNLDISNFIADLLIKDLRIGAGRKLGVITIGYVGGNPKFIKDVANAYVDAYIETILEMNNDSPKRTAVWFKKEVDTYQGDYESSLQVLAEYQQDNGIFESSEFSYEKDFLTKLNTQLLDAKAQYNQLTLNLKEVDPSLENYSSIFENSTIDQIRIDLNKAKLEFYKNAADLNQNHPDYKRLIGKVSSLRTFLKQEMTAAHQKQVRKQTSLLMTIDNLKVDIENQKQKISSLSERFNELESLQSKVDETRKTLALAKERLNQILLQSKSSSSESEISILSQAIEPSEPENSKSIKVIILGVVLGFLLAVGYAMLRELVNRRIRIDDDVYVSVGLPVLGHLQDGSKR